MHFSPTKWMLPVAWLLLTPTLEAQADAYAGMTPEQKGLAIAQAADKLDEGFGDLTANMKMILKNSHGDTSIREMRMRIKEVIGDGDMSLSVFDKPADVKGTAMLTHSHALSPDDQWMYLPALKRVKRISSRNKSGPFMGSEFAFEDLGSQEVEKYTYKWLRDEQVNGRDVYVIERYPAYEYSGYTRQVAWVDKEMHQPWQAEYYDRKNTLLKSQTFGDYKQYLGHYWRPGRMEMVNHQTHKSTELLWNDYQFQVGLDQNDFDQNSLKRAR